MKEISEFASNNIEIRKHFYGGWVVKAPFSTGNEPISRTIILLLNIFKIIKIKRNIVGGKEIIFCNSINEIYAAIETLAGKQTNLNVPYLIVQPRLANRKEYKICILSDPYKDEQLQPFLCIHPKPSSEGRAFFSADVLEFAKLAKRKYEEFVSPLTYPVFRVDIMRLQNGKLVVNEFESLEAMIQSGSNGHAKRAYEDARSENFVQSFWESELTRILESRKKRKFNHDT